MATFSNPGTDRQWHCVYCTNTGRAIFRAAVYFRACCVRSDLSRSGLSELCDLGAAEASLSCGASWDTEIRKARPDARYIANSGGGALSGLDDEDCGRDGAHLFADRQCRSGEMAIWANGKECQGSIGLRWGTRRSAGIFNVGIVAPYRWLNSAKSPAETRLGCRTALPMVFRPWFNMVSGQVA